MIVRRASADPIHRFPSHIRWLTRSPRFSLYLLAFFLLRGARFHRMRMQSKTANGQKTYTFPLLLALASTASPYNGSSFLWALCQNPIKGSCCEWNSRPIMFRRRNARVFREHFGNLRFFSQILSDRSMDVQRDERYFLSNIDECKTIYEGMNGTKIVSRCRERESQFQKYCEGMYFFRCTWQVWRNDDARVSKHSWKV